MVADSQETVCSLRPYAVADVDRFSEEFSTPQSRGELQWFGFQNAQRSHAEFEQTGYLAEDGGRLVIEAGGAWAGRIQWFRRSWGPSASWCWEIGILIVPDFRGQGIGTCAQRQLVSYLFGHTHAHRVQAVTDVANMAEQRALEKARFTQEGCLRAAQWRSGEWHDQLIYSTPRTDVA